MSIFRKLFSSKASGSTKNVIALKGTLKGDDPYDQFLSAELKKILSPGEATTLTYPILDFGLRAEFSGQLLLSFYTKEITKLRNGAGLTRADFDLHIGPVLLAFAEYAHLLPASKSHHHRLAGGLLAHSLDVACRAVSTAQLTAFDTGFDPSRRTLRRERWYVASIFAALLHDAGKPQTDYVIHDKAHEIIWLGSEPIPAWAEQNNISHYFLSWVKDRGEKHKVLSSTLVERFIPPHTRDWLKAGGQDLYLAMIDAITCADPKSTLTSIIIKADSNSVEVDLKTHNYDGVNMGGMAVNVPSIFNRAARYLVENETWTANLPGSRIWSTTQGIFLSWKGSVDEINAYLTEFKIQGLPRGPESLGNALVDHGVLERSPSGDIYWMVTPDILANPSTGKSIKLKCVKVINPLILFPYDVQPPAIAVVIGEEPSAVRYDPEDGGLGISLAAESTNSAGLDPNSAPGAVAPMFSLDTVAAPAQTQILSLPVAAPTSPTPTKEPASVHTSSTITIGGAQEVPAQAPAKAQQSAGKGNSGKPAANPGITLDFSGSAPAKPGLIINSGPTAATAGDQAIEALKARVGGKSNSGPKPQPQPQPQPQTRTQKQHKKQKTNHNQPNHTPAPSAAPVAGQPADVLVQPLPDTGESSQPKTPYTSGEDPFANIDGITLAIDSEEHSTDKKPHQDEWADPFATQPPSHLAEKAVEDPVAIEITGELSAVSFDEPDAGLGGESEYDLPGDLCLTVQPTEIPDTKSAPVAAPKATAEQRQDLESREPVESISQIEPDLGLEDFDHEIMALTGMPQPTYMARAAERSDRNQQPRPHGLAVPTTFTIPEEFRFSEDPGLEIVGIRDLPSDSPSGFGNPPSDIEIRVREMAAVPSHSSLIEVPTEEIEQRSEADNGLGEFDLPQFNAGIVKGAVSNLSVGSIGNEPKNVTPAATVQVQAPYQPKPKPISTQLKGLPTAAVRVGGGQHQGNEGAAPPAPVAPSVAISRAPSQPVKSIRIGQECLPNNPKKAAKVVEEDKIAVIVHCDIGLRSTFTESEGQEIESYLDRTPELYQKLKFYASDFKKAVNVVHYRTFVRFDPHGFTRDDLIPLSRAMWIWTDFTNDELEPVRLFRQEGVVLSSYLSECLCYLTGGEYNLARSYPFTKLDFKTQAELAQMVISRSENFVDTNGVRIITIYRGLLKKLAHEYQVSELDLRTALIATHDTTAVRQTLLVKTYAKELSYE